MPVYSSKIAAAINNEERPQVTSAITSAQTRLEVLDFNNPAGSLRQELDLV